MTGKKTVLNILINRKSIKRPDEIEEMIRGSTLIEKIVRSKKIMEAKIKEEKA